MTSSLPSIRLRFGLHFGLTLAWMAACAVAPASVFAQTEPVFHDVGRDVIPRQVVKTLAQDRQGFLWVATGDGLVRFDGHRFQAIERRHADPARRNLGWVRAMVAARDGRVWISSEADGLVSYDPAMDRIDDHADRGRGSLPAPVLALAEDLDGAIWSGTHGGGLERHAAASGAAARVVTSFVHRADDPGSLPDDRIEALRVDGAGTLWVGSWQGLSRRLAGSSRFEPVPARDAAGGEQAAALTGRRVLALLVSADRRLWIGTQQGDLVVLDPSSGSARWLAPPPNGRGATTALIQSDDGRVWVGTERGIEVWDAAGSAPQHRLRHDPRRQDTPAANQVTTLLRDRAGAIWVGGLGIGLQRHNPADAGIQVRRAEPDAQFDGNVHGLLALADGQIWAATSSVPLVALDRRLQPQGPVPLPNGAASAAGFTRVQAMTQAADGPVWLATSDRLVQMDPQRRILSQRRHGVGEVVRLLAAADGSLWLATQDGLFVLPAHAAPDARPTRVTLAASGKPLGGAIHALAVAPDGALWLGGANGLLRLPAGRHDGIEPVSSPEGAGLGNPVVGGLLFGRDGTLWVDTAITGLHRAIDAGGGPIRFDRVSTRHGIHNRPFGLNLLEDRRGRIWTQQYVYDPAGDQLIELTAADGKDFGMGWFFSYAKTGDGRFLFGGTQGVLVVEPERFDASTYMPPLVVTSLRVDGRRASTAGLPSGLVLGPEHHGVAIEFAALEFSDPQRIRYAYRLQGIDSDWVPTGADFRVASYGNLPPGDYTLRVKSTNRNGHWRDDELAVLITVQPAWWQRPLTQALTAIAALGLVWAFIQRRTRRLRRSQQDLQAKVQERTAELLRTTQALHAQSAALEQASLTDPLSGMRNRRFLTQHVDSDVALSIRQHEKTPADTDADLIFFLLDIDHFKDVNDRHGHAAGDAVIRQMLPRLSPLFRETDHIVRWGGEEFLVVARGTSRQHAASLAERVREAVAGTPFTLDDGSALNLTTSIGFACLPLAPAAPHRFSWSDTVNVADAALLQAKADGRDRWVGVLDCGSLDLAAIRDTDRASDWLGSGRMTVLRR